jgi:predicted nucleic acid-binding protein
VIVVDASVLAEILLQTRAAESVERQLFDFDQKLHAPHLLDIEVAHVVRRYSATGAISAGQGRAALLDLAEFPLRRHPHTVLLQRVWKLRDNLSAYDAIYVALAEALNAPLFTRDRRLAAAAGVHARIEVI